MERWEWDDDWSDDRGGDWGDSKPRAASPALYVPAAKSRLRAAQEMGRTPPDRPALHLQEGDSVSHSAFGQGLVLRVQPMGGDALLEIAFDQVGTKKLMLKVASRHLKKL